MLKRFLIILLIWGVTGTPVYADCLNPQEDSQLCENKEILYKTGEGILLKEKADELGTPAKIYEYLRNNSEYSPYHGARSNSINTFQSLRGNDVDLTSALLAMLRSQGIKARYVKGNIKILKTELANWLGVLDTALAVSLLSDQGVQNVDGSDPDYVTFEHVWAEALINYSDYRGGQPSIDAVCSTESGTCRWIPLDVSFKQKEYKEIYKTLLQGLSFDYDAYYNAQNPSSPDYQPGMKNKSPLEIFEETALEYLRANHPGVTLEDVIDKGEVITVESMILPASLPYEVVSGTITQYDSVADHDTAESVDWTKYLRSKVIHPICGEHALLPNASVSLAELSTKQFTATLFTTQNGVAFGHRLDGEPIGTNISAGSVTFTCAEGSFTIDEGSLVNLELEIDVEPGVTPQKVTYENLVVGGYYLIASGGETSNESQLRRATEKLLQANDQFTILIDDAGTPDDVTDDIYYVDKNSNGGIDAEDVLLKDDLAAQDALTGGLLYVAQSLYYTRLREDSERYGRLKGIISPISAYLGVVSTTEEVEYLNDVPFAITPGGLLIDLKGIRLNGTWDVDQPEAFSNEGFLFLGHIGSSLEHEVWQAITGYDAISTVRGIQFAMEQGHQLVNPKKNSQVDTFPSSVLDLGFSNSAPAEFAQNEYDMFGRRLVSWGYNGADPVNDAFNVFRPNVDGYASDATERLLVTYRANNGIDSFYSNYDTLENSLITAQASEGQLKTGFTLNSTGTVYQTYDVLSASVTTPSGFEVGSFSRTASNMYQYILNETSQHADGVYAITITPKVADSSDVRTATGSGFTGYTVLDTQNTSPSGFVTNASISGDILTITFTESAGHSNGTYNVSTQVRLYRGGYFYTINSSVSIEIIGNRFVDGTLTLNTSMDVSDDQNISCNGGPNGETIQYTGPPSSLLVDLENCFNNVIAVDNLGNFTDFFDRNMSFDPAIHAYRSREINLNDYDVDFIVKEVRPFMYGHITNTWGEYLMPSRLPQDQYYLFSIYLKNGYDNNSNDLIESTYGIVNKWGRVSGGGYVTATEAIDPTIDPDFNNEVFTDLNNISVSNNDVILTPSTVDPVSTVTGNMYHDETDFVIKGKGLDYIFTRTYNSNQATNSSADLPLSKGWTHSYNMHLTANDYGKFPNYPQSQAPENGNEIVSSISFMNERGGETNYLVDGENAKWFAQSPSGVYDILELNTPVTGQHTITYRNGVKYIFEGVNGADMHTVGDFARLKQIADPYGNQLNFSYNGSGQLETISDNLGISGRTGITLSYHPDGRIDTVSDWTGRDWRYTYLNGNLVSVENPLSQSNQYTYHQDSSLLKDISKPELRNGNLVTTTFDYYENDRAFSYTNMQDETEILDYDLFRKRTRVIDPRGFIRTHLYDGNGALVKLEEPDNGILLFENNDDGMRYKKIDALGYDTTYSYCFNKTLDGCSSDTGGNVTREQDAYLNTVDYDYAIFDQIGHVKDKNGNERFYTYYDTTVPGTGAVMGKLQKVEAVIGVQTVTLEEYTYYDNGNPKQLIEYIDKDDASKKRVTDYFYEVDQLNPNRVTVTAIPSGEIKTTRYTYDSLGRVLTETIQDQTTTFAYDTLSRVETVTDPLGNIKELMYDANGKVTEERVHYKKLDASYDTRTNVVNEYDVADRLVKTTDIYGNETLLEYDPAGNLLKTTDANNHSASYEYDPMGRSTAAIDANGHKTETVYDLAGRVVKIVDANGHATSFEYDALGRKTKSISEMGRETRYEYDANNNLVKVFDANVNAPGSTQPVNSYGCTVYNEYDEFNRLVRSVDANNAETLYTYNLLGNLTSITDAEGRTTEFIYNQFGQVVEIRDPMVQTPTDQVTTFTYDQVGNILTKTDRKGQVTQYTYDYLNRLVQADYSADGTSESWGYDIYGDLVTVSNQDVIYSYTYDLKHRLTSKLDNRMGGKSLSWQYDAVGNVISKTDYQGEVTEYLYDATNRLVSMRNQGYVQVSYHYDPAGRLLNRILSNGSSTNYKYDNDNRMIELSNKSAGDFAQLRTYTHDEVGNIKTVTENGETITYTYDALYRLEDADYSVRDSLDVHYTYDLVGNRTNKDTQTGNFEYFYNNDNRLTEVRQNGSVLNTFDYDENGSTLAKRDNVGAAILSFTYDQKRRVRSITTQTETIQYQYDPNDFRISQTGKNYLLEGEHLEAEYDDAANIRAKYLRGAIIDEVVNGYLYDETGNKTNYTFHHDNLRSVTGLSGHDGTTLETTEYGPFGNEVFSTGSSDNTLKYTGREEDTTGLYYYRARYYDPEVGRFLTEDPKGFDAGVNFYAYVLNNPINYNDPLGLEKEKEEKKVEFSAALMGAEFSFVIYDSQYEDGWLPGFFPPGDPNVTFTTTFAGIGLNIIPESFYENSEQDINVSVGLPGSDYFGVTFDVEGPPKSINVGIAIGPPVSFSTSPQNFAQIISEFLEPTVQNVSENFIEPATQLFSNALQSIFSSGGAASGGFVLYPRKPNMNMIRTVYHK